MVLYISDLIPKSWGQFGSGKKIQQLSVKGYFTYAVHRREKSYILHSITPRVYGEAFLRGYSLVLNQTRHIYFFHHWFAMEPPPCEKGNHNARSSNPPPPVRSSITDLSSSP
jgi:hypothetical protein